MRRDLLNLHTLIIDTHTNIYRIIRQIEDIEPLILNTPTYPDSLLDDFIQRLYNEQELLTSLGYNLPRN